jgi:glycosyltransferase involved in cell wall biosynthesis
METWIRRYATKIVAISQAAMEAYMGQGWKEDPRTEIIYHGIDIRAFRNPSDRLQKLAEFGIPPSAKVVIHVGTFRPAKDHETLVRSAEAVVEHRKDVHFLLVGGGILMPKIRKLVAAKGLQDYIHFAGSRRDVPQLLMASDCFIFPSRWEGLGGAVLEALAAGLPVVAGDVPAIREIAAVSDHVYLVPTGEAAGFAQKATEILANLDSYKSTPGQLPQRFRLDRYVQNTLALYQDNTPERKVTSDSS